MYILYTLYIYIYVYYMYPKHSRALPREHGGSSEALGSSLRDGAAVRVPWFEGELTGSNSPLVNVAT